MHREKGIGTDGTVVTGADLTGGDVDERHVGRGTVGGKAGGGDLDVRPGSAGVAAVQQIALTTWDWATLLKRVGLINAHLTPRAPPGRNPHVPSPRRVDALHAAAFIAVLHAVAR